MFNVSTPAGQHIGFIAGSFRGVLLVALTESNLETSWLDWQSMEQAVADYLGCYGFLGGINRDKLELKLREIWQQENIYSTDDMWDRELLLRKLYLECCPKSRFVNLDSVAYTGYVLMYREDLEFQDEQTVILDTTLNYIAPEQEVLGQPPIYFEVIDYPNVDISRWQSSVSIEEVKYATHLQIRSGNVVRDISFAVPLTCKMGDSLLLYPKGDQFRALVTAGIVYNFLDQEV
ncbi:MAG: hypothetical protein FH749_02815 [Firmicutes bacterium]|nr:hypothetical protein [Bacillota bacterium]